MFCVSLTLFVLFVSLLETGLKVSCKSQRYFDDIEKIRESIRANNSQYAMT